MDEKTAINKYSANGSTSDSSEDRAADGSAVTEIGGSFRVELVQDQQTYEGLRDLWCKVFGDEPEYVDHMYHAFGADNLFSVDKGIEGCDIEGYVIKDGAGKVVSALTCYLCGTYLGRPVYVSYAICTDPAYRGKGLAGQLTSFVCESVVQGKDGISIVSPASESLIEFYKGLEYEPHFFAETVVAYAEDDEEPAETGEVNEKVQELFADEDFVEFEPELNLAPLSARAYNDYRETFLADTPHIRLSEKMLDFIRTDSKDSDGLLLINNGDGICVVSEIDPEQKETLILTELLVNPMLKAYSEEIDSEIATQLACRLGAERVVYRRPGCGYCQSMISGDGMIDFNGKTPIVCSGEAPTKADSTNHLSELSDHLSEPPYYGFPID